VPEISSGLATKPCRALIHHQLINQPTALAEAEVKQDQEALEAGRGCELEDHDLQEREQPAGSPTMPSPRPVTVKVTVKLLLSRLVARPAVGGALTSDALIQVAVLTVGT
jgi:hypothetical protein